MDELTEFEKRWWPGARPGRPEVLVASSYREAWELYEAQEGRYSFPQRISDACWWLYPRRAVWPEVGLGAEYPHDPELREETLGLYATASPTAPPSPGSSAAAAKLRDWDRQRISDEVARKAERRRQEQPPDPAPVHQPKLW